MWVLITYQERTLDGDYPNTFQRLSPKLALALSMVMDIFPPDQFDIVVRNVGDKMRDTDFSLVRKEDGQGIGEMEFQPNPNQEGRQMTNAVARPRTQITKSQWDMTPANLKKKFKDGTRVLFIKTPGKKNAGRWHEVWWLR